MARRFRVIRIGLLALATGWPGSAWAQNAQLSASSSGVRLRLPAVGLIDGRVRDRLLDGRSVKVDLALAVLARPGEMPVARAAQTCTFSFDLWEERFAVTGSGTPARSISHLRSADAEAWCVDQLVVPLPALGEGARTRSFWIRLDLHVLDAAPRAAAPPDEGLSLQRLIDVLSRRREESAAHRVIEVGPLRLAP